MGAEPSSLCVYAGHMTPRHTCWDRRTVSSPRGVAPRLLWAGGMEHKGRSPLPALEASGRRVKVQRSRPRGCGEGRCLLVRCCRVFFSPCWTFCLLAGTGWVIPEHYQRRAVSWVPVGRGAVCWWRSSTPAIFHVSMQLLAVLQPGSVSEDPLGQDQGHSNRADPFV